MTVTIDTIELDFVLSWNEESTTNLPIKKVIRKSSSTTQPQYYCVTPREIIITARVTSDVKTSLYSLKDENTWQALYDYDGITKVDDVWIKNIKEHWEGNKNWTKPWLVTLLLICKVT